VKAISIRCPTCNAALQVSDDATMVTCTYCHTPCRIQARSRIWQRPLQVSAPPNLPVARAPVRTGAMVVLGMATAMVVASGAAGVVLLTTGDLGEQAEVRSLSTPMEPRTDSKKSSDRSATREILHWNSRRPLLRDLDGDGNDDLIGRIQLLGSSTPPTHLAAFAGNDGHALWRSAAISARVGTSPKIALAGELVLLTGDDGKLRSYAVADGGERWVAELGEKVAMICNLAAPGMIRVVTEDDRGRDLQLSDGAIIEVRGKSRRQLRSCEEIATDDDVYGGLTPYDPFRRLPSVAGMYTRFSVRRGEVTLISGGKSPGTGVPMVARRDGRQVIWRAELPSSDPLTSSFDEKVLYFDDRLVLATYVTSHTGGVTRMVALSFEDGHRLWDVDLTRPGAMTVMSSVLTTQRLAISSSWANLQAFDRTTGKRVFAIGN
jgi:outer membrane protein assembly factor BamB